MLRYQRPLTFAPLKHTTKGHIAVLFTNLFFSVNYSVIKLISPQPIGPYALNVLRVIVSLVFFWSLWLFGDTPAGFQKRHFWRFVLCGLTGIALNQMLFIKGLTLTSTIHASLLILITPVMVTVFAIWVLKERFTIYKALGLALGIGGAVFLILQRSPSAGAESLLGDILVLANAIFYAFYFIIVKPLTKEYSPLHVIRWVFTIGFFFILPFGWQQTLDINWTGFAWYHYTGLFSVAFLGTFLAYYFNAYGIRVLGAGVTGGYIYTQPFIVVLIATIFLNESLTWQKILSGLMIIAGVFLVSYRSGGQAAEKI